MPFPKNDSELTKAGYKFDNRSRCTGKDCHAEIEWWITPKGKRIPLDAATMEPHWSTCPNSESFRK